MGVHGFWQTVKTASTPCSLTLLSLGNNAVSPLGVPEYKLGIDASIWFKQCSKPFLSHHMDVGKNPELRTLFFRLANLHSKLFRVNFVFDGPARPQQKRDAEVIGRPLWMVEDARKLVEAFGFECVNAPGEAEAELASMNRADHIHAVVTDDSDVFLFGAHTVIRNSGFKADVDVVDMYTLQNILENTHRSLDCDGAVLMALLSGGDYDMRGLPQCGRQTALGLVRYGFGASLCHVARNLTPEELSVFLVGWRQDLCEHLRHDPLGYIGRRNPTLAEAVPDTFPDIGILQAYISPAISVNHAPLISNAAQSYHLPDLGRLAQFCSQNFAWTEDTIKRKFQSLIWPGYILGVVRNEIKLRAAQGLAMPLSETSQLRPQIKRRRTYHGILEYKIFVSVTTLLWMTFNSPSQQNDHQHQDNSPLPVWIPAKLYDQWAPGKIWNGLFGEADEEVGAASTCVSMEAQCSRQIIDLTNSPSSSLIDLTASE